MSHQERELSLAIQEMAQRIFTICGAEDDFCVQDVGIETIIFGGTNRVILDHRGWYIDTEHCTEKFAKAWIAIYE